VAQQSGVGVGGHYIIGTKLTDSSTIHCSIDGATLTSQSQHLTSCKVVTR
jgi:hypothetical protein